MPERCCWARPIVRFGLVDRLAACFRDVRCPELIEHQVVTLVGQRVFGIALGYEDLNDHDELRHDPVMAVLAGKLEGAPRGLRAGGRQIDAEPAGAEPAGADALSQDQPRSGGHQAAVRRPVPGGARASAERRSSSISMPPTIRCTAIRKGGSSTAITTATATCRSTSSAAAICWPPSCGARTSTPRPARWRRWPASSPQIRRRWPRVRILLRADSGFAREELMAWCEANGVRLICSAWRATDRLIAAIKAELEAAQRRAGVPASRHGASRTSSGRRGAAGAASAGSSAKAELTKDEANPRFVVTSLTRAECKARYLYEKVYCARGEMENRIKECQLDLFADRTSTATMRANQLRLWFASMAYVLLCALRRIGSASHAVRQSDLRHHPSQAAEDRRPRARQCPPHQGRDGVSVSGSPCLGLRCQASRRRQRARLARLTRAAATRNPRGITPRPTETASRLS